MKAALAVLALMVCLTACAAPDAGVITGGIDWCSGLGVLPNQPHYAAGEVTVFAGQTSFRAVGSGNSIIVFPTTVVARQRVGLDGTFSFTLKPGDYVLQAHYLIPPASVEPFVNVTVTTGQTRHDDIPNECM